MNQGRPDLVAVPPAQEEAGAAVPDSEETRDARRGGALPPAQEEAGAAVPDSEETRDARRGGALPWLLAAALAGTLLGWSFEAQQSRRLEASLEASNAALEEARSTLAAYETHTDDARQRTAALLAEASLLADRLAELEAWLAAAPLGPPAETQAAER